MRRTERLQEVWKMRIRGGLWWVAGEASDAGGGGLGLGGQRTGTDSRFPPPDGPIGGGGGGDAGAHAVLTLHRPSNVDDRPVLAGILDALERIRAELPVVAPLHPPASDGSGAFGTGRASRGNDSLMLIDPLGYIDFLKLMSDARVVLTDSGGIQEETTILGVPCLTLRENTEQPSRSRSGPTVWSGRTPRMSCPPSTRWCPDRGRAGRRRSGTAGAPVGSSRPLAEKLHWPATA